MTKPRLLDLFCKAGGAARGYQRAGFYVVGVDVEPQPRYAGDEFIQGDALTFPLDGFDAVHASPPCQAFTAYKRRPDHVAERPNLIPAMRERLRAAGVPFVMENVHGAPLLNAVRYCGSSFGLDVRRHRYFESSHVLIAPPCDHGRQTPRFKQATNRANIRSTVEVGVWRIPLAVQQTRDGYRLDDASRAQRGHPARLHRAYRASAHGPYHVGVCRMIPALWQRGQR